MKIPGNPITRFLGAAVVVMMVAWGYTAYKNWGSWSPFRQKASVAAAKTAAAVVVVAKSDTVRHSALLGYANVRSRTRSNPGAAELGDAADKVIKADSNAISARDSAFAAQKEELTLWQNKPGPPRLAAYAEGLYDLAHMVPVVRIGATFRVIGPISLSAAGQYAAPQAGQSKPDFRATVGIRYDF